MLLFVANEPEQQIQELASFEKTTGLQMYRCKKTQNDFGTYTQVGIKLNATKVRWMFCLPTRTIMMLGLVPVST